MSCHFRTVGMGLNEVIFEPLFWKVMGLNEAIFELLFWKAGKYNFIFLRFGWL